MVWEISAEYLPIWFNSGEEEVLSKFTVLPHCFPDINKSPEEGLGLNSKSHKSRVGGNISLLHAGKCRLITLSIKKLIEQSCVTIMFKVLALNFLEKT